MKNFLVLCLFIFASASFGETITLYDKKEKFDHEYDVNFDINAELGRAWTVVTEIEDDYDDTWEKDIRIKVKGLSYKSETKQIFYKDVLCANVVTRGRWVFKREVIELTENCSFKTKFYEKFVDDGFEIKKYDYVKIDLVIK